MTFSRRRTLRYAGASIAGMVLAGCLSTAQPGAGDDDREPGGPGGDADDLSIDARLHNESESARTFAVSIQDVDDQHLASEEWVVEAGHSLAVPAVARPGEPRTFEVAVDGASATETLAFDVEASPGERAGYVDIRYTASGQVGITFTPTDGAHPELPRVDEPPYEISEPECGDEGDRDPLWLCANMVADPTVTFEQVATSAAVFRDEGLQVGEHAEGDEYYATLLTDEADLDRLDGNGQIIALAEATDFDTEAVLVAQTGWGSGSETPHLKRIEATEAGIHAFGCVRRPCIGTDDFTLRTTVARFERPARLDDALVSLTVDDETRVNFAAGEGVVTLSDGR